MKRLTHPFRLCFFLLCLGILGGNSYAQSDTTALDSSQQRMCFRVNFVGLGAGIEYPILQQLSVYGELGTGFDLGKLTPVSGGSGQFQLTPYAQASVRYYYNLKKREEAGKDTRLWSGNFVCVNLKYGFETRWSAEGLIIGPAWGLQRNIGKKRGFVGFHLGPGVYVDGWSEWDTAQPFVNMWIGLGIAF